MAHFQWTQKQSCSHRKHNLDQLSKQNWWSHVNEFASPTEQLPNIDLCPKRQFAHGFKQTSDLFARREHAVDNVSADKWAAQTQKKAFKPKSNREDHHRGKENSKNDPICWLFWEMIHNCNNIVSVCHPKEDHKAKIMVWHHPCHGAGGATMTQTQLSWTEKSKNNPFWSLLWAAINNGDNVIHRRTTEANSCLGITTDIHLGRTQDLKRWLQKVPKNAQVGGSFSKQLRMLTTSIKCTNGPPQLIRGLQRQIWGGPWKKRSKNGLWCLWNPVMSQKDLDNEKSPHWNVSTPFNVLNVSQSLRTICFCQWCQKNCFVNNPDAGRLPAWWMQGRFPKCARQQWHFHVSWHFVFILLENEVVLLHWPARRTCDSFFAAIFLDPLTHWGVPNMHTTVAWIHTAVL